MKLGSFKFVITQNWYNLSCEFWYFCTGNIDRAFDTFWIDGIDTVFDMFESEESIQFVLWVFGIF